MRGGGDAVGGVRVGGVNLYIVHNNTGVDC